MDTKIALIIEDDLGFYTFLQNVLETMGIISIHSETLTKAEKLLKKGTPEIFFVDNRLPDGYGFTYIAKIRRKFPDALIVAMTSDETKNAQDLAESNGADYFVDKPLWASRILDFLKAK